MDMTELPTEGMTKKQYYREVDARESDIEARRTYLSEAEKKDITDKNDQAHETAILQLISEHRTEYESYVVEARKRLGIADKVESTWFELIDSLDPLDFPTRL